MAKPKAISGQAGQLGGRVGGATDSLLEASRSVADALPGVVDGARGMVGTASRLLDDCSDEAVVAALGFSVGITFGLFLAGAPRMVLAVALIPTAITMRAAMQRGVGSSRVARSGRTRGVA